MNRLFLSFVLCMVSIASYAMGAADAGDSYSHEIAQKVNGEVVDYGLTKNSSLPYWKIQVPDSYNESLLETAVDELFASYGTNNMQPLKNWFRAKNGNICRTSNGNGYVLDLRFNESTHILMLYMYKYKAPKALKHKRNKRRC